MLPSQLSRDSPPKANARDFPAPDIPSLYALHLSGAVITESFRTPKNGVQAALQGSLRQLSDDLRLNRPIREN